MKKMGEPEEFGICELCSSHERRDDADHFLPGSAVCWPKPALVLCYLGLFSDADCWQAWIRFLRRRRTPGPLKCSLEDPAHRCLPLERLGLALCTPWPWRAPEDLSLLRPGLSNVTLKSYALFGRPDESLQEVLSWCWCRSLNRLPTMLPSVS